MIYILYLILAIIVVSLSIKISYYVDLIDKTTDLSGAFIGGVMLAAVTSLPELFTSISATVFLGKPELVIGNILGSNIFNIAILATLLVIMYKKINHSYISRSHTTVATWLIVTYGLLTLPIYFNKDLTVLGVSLVSLAIGVIYIICIKKMATSTEEKEDKDPEVYTSLTTKQLFSRFAFFSILLVVFSIGITYASDLVAIKLNLNVTLAGALLLGIATSLPELASCIALAKIGNLNAMIGNITGSNIFNLFILLLADILFTRGSIYTSNQQSYNLVFFGSISTLAILIVLIANIYKEKLSYKTNQIIYMGGGFVSIMGYILFLSLSK
ncbi:MAG TPA: cation transporter [Epulopiscium sp.]|nr:cation transporter [Candidatus Epulonipiscium sp.]